MLAVLQIENILSLIHSERPLVYLASKAPVKWESREASLRYYIVEDADGWQVVDVWTHDPAWLNGRELCGLSFCEADDAIEALSQIAIPAEVTSQARHFVA